MSSSVPARTSAMDWRKGGEAMNVFELLQVVGFALTLFMIGYTLGKKK